jgi:mRNA interferase HicA
VKRTTLIKKIQEAARAADVEWTMERQGKQHEIWRCGATKVSVPRHREINELTAHGICKDLDDELGKDWWR